MYILTIHNGVMCEPCGAKSKSKRTIMKLSLRTEKLNSQNFQIRINHNSRATFSKSFDSSKSKNNINFTSKHFQNSVENVWDYIRSDFNSKKSQNLIQKNKRFLKRNSTKTKKDKDGNKKTEQVETSILREFVIQLGNEKEGFFSQEDSQKYYQKIQDFIADKYKLTMLRSDLHLDEAVPHLHFIATTYDFANGEFSKEFNKKNSYEAMQKEVFNYCKNELGINLEGYEKKECLGADYIAPAVYRKNKPMFEKAKEYCKKKKDLEEQLAEKPKEIEKIVEKEKIKEVIKEVENPLNRALEEEVERLKKRNEEIIKMGRAKIKNLKEEIKKLNKTLSDAFLALEELKIENSAFKEEIVSLRVPENSKKDIDSMSIDELELEIKKAWNDEDYVKAAKLDKLQAKLKEQENVNIANTARKLKM